MSTGKHRSKYTRNRIMSVRCHDALMESGSWQRYNPQYASTAPRGRTLDAPHIQEMRQYRKLHGDEIAHSSRDSLCSVAQ